MGFDDSKEEQLTSWKKKEYTMKSILKGDIWNERKVQFYPLFKSVLRE